MPISPSADFLIPFQAAYFLLQDAASRDRMTARRTALVEILWHERYLSRENLMARVEDRLGGECFGETAWEDTFNRDMHAVKEAFQLAGHALGYTRKKDLAGYYLKKEARLHPDLSQAISASIAEIDQRQLGIYRALGLPQRFRRGCSASDTARWEARYARGIRKEEPGSLTTAGFIQMIFRIAEETGMDHALAGSAAAWLWGEPRPARELEMAVNASGAETMDLVERLRQAGLLAVELPEPKRKARRAVLSAVHPGSEWRVNFILLSPADEPGQLALQRKIVIDLGRSLGRVHVLSPEDLLLLSLRDFSFNRQASHIRRIAAIVLSQAGHLDRSYIKMQAEKNGLIRLWEELEQRTLEQRPIP